MAYDRFSGPASYRVDTMMPDGLLLRLRLVEPPGMPSDHPGLDARCRSWMLDVARREAVLPGQRANIQAARIRTVLRRDRASRALICEAMLFL